MLEPERLTLNGFVRHEDELRLGSASKPPLSSCIVGAVEKMSEVL
jgi:hypothetical protein